MFSKIKKYVIGFFVLCGGILFAFLSGKSAGRKDEKFKGIKGKIKDTKKSIKEKAKKQKNIQKSLKDKKKSLEQIKEQRESFGVYDKNVSANDAADFLRNYKKKK